ncbi:MAG TPA: carboxypeptidase regulatory-like domain-containing protein, partial [Planctomycetota bacterium]|nr:carboxypeptidase regulatory-like domain-containing protein [Planctomycetota bacterium]
RLETSADGYLDNTLTGIDPTSSPPVLVTLQDGLRIAGVVRDADTTPVTMFAVRANRVRGLPQPARSAGNFDDLAPRDGNLDEATRVQLRAREVLRESMGEGRRGGRGGPPDGGGGGGPGLRDLGRPERHARGAFVLTGLQEGIYEVHVQSPDHTRYRSAEVELRLGIAPPDLSIVLDDGVFVAGVVRSEAGDPVAGARVELRPATADEGTPRRGERGNNGQNSPELQALGRDLRQAFAATRFTQEATTAADGLFVIKHAQRGSYRLHAEARNYSSADSDTFELQADRSGFELRLGLLGSIAGKVRGLAEREVAEARVAAVPIGAAPGGGFGALFGRGRGGGPGGNPFQGVGCGPDGAYRIDGLVPGTYAVRAWIGSPQELMRELAPQFLDGSMLADVTVRAAEVSTLDVTVTRPQVGTVSGNVMHNGSPAAGFQVELTRQDETGTPQNGFGQRGPGGGGRAGFGGFGRSFQAAVATSGNFSIPNVPAGSYRLRVQAARRGGPLHEEAVLVSVNRTTQCLIALQTANLAGSITRDDGGNAAELNGRVYLLPGLTAVPENLRIWQRENPGFDAQIQNGTFKFTALKPGGYLLVLAVRGREHTTLPIVVGSTDQTVVVPAGKAAAATENEAASSPRPSNRPPR